MLRVSNFAVIQEEEGSIGVNRENKKHKQRKRARLGLDDEERQKQENWDERGKRRRLNSSCGKTERMIEF